jgi:superfamily II DNA or RNA helicase
VLDNHNYFVDDILVHNCHHATSKSYQKILGLFLDASVLGVTATPTRLDGSGLDGVFDELVQGVSVQDLIVDGYLSPYRLFADPNAMSTDDCKISAGDYKLADIEKANNIIELSGNIVNSYKRLANNGTAIVFAVSVAHSIAIADRYNQSGIPAIHLDGTSSDHERASAIEKLKTGTIKVISNCGLFDEGVDLPSVGCIQIAKPTRSLTKYLQMIGRGLRPDKSKAEAILIDHTKNYAMHGLPDEGRVWGLSGVTSGRSRLYKTKDGEITRYSTALNVVENEEIELVDVAAVWRSVFVLSQKDIDAYLGEETAQSIAKRLSVSPTTITAALARQWVEVRNPSTTIRLSPEDIDAYQGGESAASIARRTGVSGGIVVRALDKLGIEVRNPKAIIVLSPEDVNAYQSGESASSIGRRLETKCQTVLVALRRQGVSVRPRGKH